MRGILLSLILLSICGTVHGFVPILSERGPTFHTTALQATRREVDELSRRRLFATLGTVLTVVAASTQAASADEEAVATKWLTGKRPKAPGEKPRDPKDTKGTRKDPSFLRSLSDCKSQCETSAGYGSDARTKQECLSECQDVCCTTYEQCTFSIVPR